MDNENNNFTQNFQEETDKKKETACEIGFWISILGLILSLFGMIIYILDFYFAYQGLKTRKKGKAIATIVMSIISIVVIIIQFLLA